VNFITAWELKDLGSTLIALKIPTKFSFTRIIYQTLPDYISPNRARYLWP
jgi:hypothetical protein